jgi:hypothetical protein
VHQNLEGKATFANNRSIYPNAHPPKPIENPEPFGVPHRFRLLPEVAFPSKGEKKNHPLRATSGQMPMIFLIL